MKKRFSQCYYLILGLILVGQIAFTLYQTSRVVVYGHRQQKLQQEKMALDQQQQALRLELAQATALINCQQQAELASSQEIKTPVQIRLDSSLASAQ